MSNELTFQDNEQNSNAVVPMAKNELDAMYGVIAKDADPILLRNTIKVAVVKAYVANSRAFEKADVTILINDLRDEILRVFPGIRLGAIGLAIHKGAMGEYEKVYSLSLAFFVQCLRAYMSSDAQAIAGKKFLQENTQLLLPAYSPSKEEIENNRKVTVLKAFEDFKKDGHYNDFGNYVFESLALYGVINFEEDDKEEIWKNAKSRVVNKLLLPTTSIDRRNENSRVLSEIKATHQHPYIYMEAKKIALAKFFIQLIEMETELSDLIEA